MKKTLGLACAAAALIALVTGCNDTLRQFITPLPGPGGDPNNLAHAVVLSTNPGNGQPSILPAVPCNAGGSGSTLHIDVSGDSVVGVVPSGPNPQFLGKGSNRVFILNCDNTINSYIALLPLSVNPQVVTQPTTPPVSGAIGGGTSSGGNFYITNSGSGNTSMISSAFSAITAVLPVGSEPVAVAGNSSNSKIYIVNHTSNDVTVVSTTDNAIMKTISLANVALPLKPGLQPIWAVMSADGVHVFVVNQGSNNVSVIDTLLDIVITTVDVGTSPNYAVYDSTLKRVYVSNTGSNSISVIDASRIDLAAVPQQLPTKIADVGVSGTPTSVVALSNGAKAYAALGNCTDAATNQTNLVTGATPHLPNCKGNLVSVIDTLSLQEKKTIQVGPGVVSIDAAPNGSKVYVISAQDITTITDNVSAKKNPPLPPQAPRTFVTPSVSAIRTSDDSVLRTPADPSITSLLPTFHTPQQSSACVPKIDPTFNDTVPLPCPAQIPFQVRTFP